MFNFFGKNKIKTPSWESLSDLLKRNVANKLMKTIKAMSGARYKVVSGFDELLRERGTIENTDEDGILNSYSRGRMLDLTRNAVRNSPTFNGILKQFDLNAIGTKGGKAIFNFKDIELSKYMREEFSKWTRNADFFDGMSFNTMLKLILKTYIIGGDLVLVFDDGLVEDSGKLLIYEPDEIGNTTEDALKKRYGAYAHQSLGRVYNENSRFIGAIVSRSQRGNEIFDANKSYLLKRDPDESMFDSFWMMPRNVFREAQGRGISPMSSSLATVLDLEDLCGFELAAAKKNSQVIALILQNSAPSEKAVMPSAFDIDTDFSSMTDEQIENAAKEVQAENEQVVTLDKVRAAGVMYQVMPENYKMELLDTKHPNATMPEFIRFLAGRSAAPFGLTEQYATLCASGSDYKSQQLMTLPVFEECQKFLEGIADWTLYRWSLWANRKGILNQSLTMSMMKDISWSWPKQAELDEQAYQNAWSVKFQNMTGSYLSYFGPTWREDLEQIKDEIEYCKANGLPHPSFLMKSGGERSESEMFNEQI